MYELLPEPADVGLHSGSGQAVTGLYEQYHVPQEFIFSENIKIIRIHLQFSGCLFINWKSVRITWSSV
jgi:hypothetical protein